MASPGRGAARVLRGSALALCCALLALSGHVVGGGRVSAVLPLVAVAAPLAAAFVVWADRQRGLLEIVAAAAASQVPFHAVFLLCGADGPPHPLGWDARMLAGHALAAAALSVLLARGEAALWALYGALSGGRSVGALLLPAVIDGRPRPAMVGVVPGRCGAGLVLATAHGRRGPPRGSAV